MPQPSLATILDGCNLSGPMKSMVRTGLNSMAPGLLDLPLSVRIDEAERRVIVSLGSNIIYDGSFDEVNAGVLG